MSPDTRHDATSPIDEEARRRFEAAWRQGNPEPIESYLPPVDHRAYLGTLEELVHIDMEVRWKGSADESGQTILAPPRVEDYLGRFPCLNEPAILRRLVQQEMRVRLRNGEQPADAEYRDRFPALSTFQAEAETTIGQSAPPRGNLPEVPGFQVHGVLGRGGMGVVLKATQMSLRRLVALKQILAGAGATSELLTRFRTEAEAIARLQHPNIVQIYEVGQAQDRPYIALEFVEGGTLAQKIGGTPLPVSEAARIAETLARALDAVLARGILHRDLKPGNVLLTADGTPKITDFGLAKQVEGKLDSDIASLTETGAIVGTPSYMAPEQAAGKAKEVGPGADIYALGAILYEMLTGRPPFRGETPMDTVVQVLKDEPVSPRRLRPKLPRDLETICLKCLEKDPRKRYGRALEIAEDLRRFQAGEPIVARPVSRGERLWRWCRRKPALASLSAALLLVLIGALAGLFFWQEAEHTREQQALEFQHCRQEDALRRRTELRGAAEASRTLALGELRANRFASAQKFLQQALFRLQDETELEDLRQPLAQQHDRVSRLVEFYQQSDRAERLAFFENDEKALQTCEAGLKCMGLFNHRAAWWAHLPAADLTQEQAEKLRRDINHQLTLLAGLWVKEGLTNPKSGKSTPAYRTAIDVVEMVQAFHKERKLPPSYPAQLLECYCRASLWEFGKLKSFRGMEPTTPSECYFTGIALFWMSQNPKDTISTALSYTLKLFGIDLGEPGPAARALLRRAAAGEPGHYWTQLWLGWALLESRDGASAELALNTCVTLRPDQALGYGERARALAFQATQTKDERSRKGLVQRCHADLQRALELEPYDWLIHSLRMQVYLMLGPREEALASIGRYLEVMPLPNLLHERPRDEQIGVLKQLAQILGQALPEEGADPEVESLLALVYFFLRDDQAETFAGRALEVEPTAPRSAGIRSRALVVRGGLAYRKKDFTAAQAEFRKAQALTPKTFLAGFALARSHEMLREWQPALATFRGLEKLAVTDWQRLEVNLGLSRVLREVGQLAAAEQALAQARAIDPRAAQTRGTTPKTP